MALICTDMKKNLTLYFTCILFLFTFSSCRQDGPAPIRNVKAGPKLLRAQAGSSFTNYSYISNHKQKSLGSVYTKQVLVAFASGLSAEQEQAILSQYGFVKEAAAEQVAMSSGQMHRVVLGDGLNPGQVEVALQELAGDPQITYAAPFFLNGDKLLGLTNEALVTVEAGGKELLQELAKQFNAEVLPSNSSNLYIVKLDKNSQGDALAFVNYLQGKKGIVQAEPDFVVSLNR